MNFGKVVKFSSLSEQDQNVANRAIEVKANAYFPYSKFKVGAAVISGSGVIYKGVGFSHTGLVCVHVLHLCVYHSYECHCPSCRL